MGTKKLLFFVTNLTMQLSYIRLSSLTLVAAASVAFSFVRPPTPTPTTPLEKERWARALSYTFYFMCRVRPCPSRGPWLPGRHAFGSRALPSIKYAEERA
jgi:hypothetical protein